jgi:hypothetical protein
VGNPEGNIPLNTKRRFVDDTEMDLREILNGKVWN